MFPRKSLAIWQKSAHDGDRGRLRVAVCPSLGQPASRAVVVCGCGPVCLDCYPCLHIWPVRKSDGPVFCRRKRAELCRPAIFPFCMAAKGLRITPTTPHRRGLSRCSRPLSFCRFFCLPWQVARSAIPDAPSLVRLPVRRLPIRRGKTPPLARAPVRLPVLSSSKPLSSAIESPGAESNLIRTGASCPTTTTITIRGSQTCTNPLSLLQFFLRPSRAAWSTMTANVPWSALAQVRWAQARWAMTRSLALPWAQVPAHCAAKPVSVSASNNIGLTAGS